MKITFKLEAVAHSASDKYANKDSGFTGNLIHRLSTLADLSDVLERPDYKNLYRKTADGLAKAFYGMRIDNDCTEVDMLNLMQRKEDALVDDIRGFANAALLDALTSSKLVPSSDAVKLSESVRGIGVTWKVPSSDIVISLFYDRGSKEVRHVVDAWVVETSGSTLQEMSLYQFQTVVSDSLGYVDTTKLHNHFQVIQHYLGSDLIAGVDQKATKIAVALESTQDSVRSSEDANY